MPSGGAPNVTGSPISAIARAPSRRSGANGPGPPVPSHMSIASTEPVPQMVRSAVRVASTAAESRYGATPSQTTNVACSAGESGRCEHVGERLPCGSRSRRARIEPCAEPVAVLGDDGRLAARQRRQVDLVHRTAGELRREAVGPAVVSGAEDHDLLGVGSSEQVLVDEAVPAQHVGRQPAEVVSGREIAQRRGDRQRIEQRARTPGQEQRSANGSLTMRCVAGRRYSSARYSVTACAVALGRCESCSSRGSSRRSRLSSCAPSATTPVCPESGYRETSRPARARPRPNTAPGRRTRRGCPTAGTASRSPATRRRARPSRDRT